MDFRPFLRFDQLMNMNNDAFNLREPESFEVLSASGDWVEFRIKCRWPQAVSRAFEGCEASRARR